jgi:DUF971 family protein
MSKSPAPTHIGPSADELRLQIRWSDGHLSEYEPLLLRLRCPCAGCVEEMTGRPLLDPAGVDPAVYPLEIEYVGRYALRFQWSDGHSTGIYPYDYLRRICPCRACERD